MTATRRGGILLTGRAFDSLAAAGVELQQMIDLILRFGGGGEAETGGCGRGAAYVGVTGDEFEEVESDIFGAAGGGKGSGFHGSDGSG